MFSIKESSRSCLRKLFCLSGLLLALQLSSCEKDGVLNEPVSEQQTVSGEIRLGAKVESPFLLRNMQRSVDSLSARTGLKSLTILKPTHLYVRFLPADTAQYERLVADTTLDFDPYPLDYQLTEGDSYHDPSLPADAITWQYTVVPEDYDLQGLGITYEVLDELYILDEDLEREDISVGDAQLRSGKGAGLSWKSVVDEAMIQTGNVGETTLRSKWTPAATIKAYDDLMGKYIPLQGVKVCIRYFAFLKAYHYTDANGNVSFSSKRTSVEYSIEWERDMWDIRDDGTQAYYHGPDQKEKWNLNINSGAPKSLHYSAIHRALYKYYYGDCCGLVRPSKSLTIAYRDGFDPEKVALAKTYHNRISKLIGIKPEIEVFGKNTSGVYLNVHEVVANTIHELAHASHYMYVGKSIYEATHIGIYESWATAVEWYLGRNLYLDMMSGKSNAQINIFDDEYANQNWCITSRTYYTPIFIDLYDSYNEYEKSAIYPNDIVSGYTFNFLNKNLIYFIDMSELRNFLKNNKPIGVSISDIDKLLNDIEKVWEQKESF